MNFRCERDVLSEVLVSAGRASSARTASLEVLGGIRMSLEGDRLSCTGTDMDLTITVTAQVSGSGDGVAVVRGRLVSDIVRSLEPGAVEVEAHDEEVHISSGRSHFSVRTHPAADFPRLPVPTGDEVVLLSEGLAQALRQVTRAASSEESRPILTGVLLEAEAGGLRLVATDSYRLAVRDLPGVGVLAEGQKVLVPSKALNELLRFLGSYSGDVRLRLGAHDATFALGPLSLTTRLIEGAFPDYRKLIPSGYPNRLIISREPLLDALRRVRLLADAPTTPVRVQMRPDSVELKVINTVDLGIAVEEVDAKYEGAEMSIAFSPTYFIDGVEAMGTDSVRMETLDPLKPATLQPEGSDGYLYLLMPVRVS